MDTYQIWTLYYFGCLVLGLILAPVTNVVIAFWLVKKFDLHSEFKRDALYKHPFGFPRTDPNDVWFYSLVVGWCVGVFCCEMLARMLPSAWWLCVAYFGPIVITFVGLAFIAICRAVVAMFRLNG